MLDWGDWVSWTIAASVLGVAAVLLIVVRPRAERDLAVSAESVADTGSVAVSAGAAPDSAATLAAAETVGDAMIQAGYSVTTVRDALEDIARVNHLPASQVVVFPTALLVSARGEGEHRGEHRTGAISSGEGRLLLDQVDELQRTVDAARLGVLDPASTIERIRRVREMPPTYGRVPRVVGYALLSGALAVMLGTTWTGVAVAVVLGALVGAALLVSERVPRRYGALITVSSRRSSRRSSCCCRARSSRRRSSSSRPGR
jgi:hypothetical protein